MKQFLLPPAWPQDPVLTGEDFHYLVNVRRLGIGRKLQCRTSDGEGLVAEIVAVTPGSVTLRRIDPLQPLSDNALSIETARTPTSVPAQASGNRLHLLQGIPKGKKLDLIVRQATELGVSSITPVNCKHSIPDIGENWKSKHQRYTAIVREAFQQSGGIELPEVHAPVDINADLQNKLRESRGLGLFLHERELAQSTVHEYLRAVPKDVYLVVGPEGGLAREETEQLRAFGFLPWYLGAQVLRSETAAVVGLGVLHVLLHEHWYWTGLDRNTL